MSRERDMVNKLVVKHSVNVCVSILLFTGYVYLFGIKSVRKYLDKEIVITEQEDEYPNEQDQPGEFIKNLHISIVRNQNCSNHNLSI